MKKFTLLLLLVPFAAFAQNAKVDSLRRALHIVKIDSLRAKLYIEIAYEFQNNPESAYLYADSSFQIARKLGSKSEITRCNVLMGNLKRSVGDYPTALNHLLEALNLATETQNLLLLSKTYNSLARVYSLQSPELFPKAIDYNLKALEIQKQMHDSLGLAMSYSNLGALYGDIISNKTYNIETSLQYYLLSLEMAYKLNDNRIKASALGNIGFLYTEKGNLVKAEEFVNESLKLNREIGNQSGEMITLYRLAMLYRSKKNLKESNKILEKVVEMATNVKDKDLTNNAYEGISDNYIMLGDYKLAYENYFKSVSLKFELYNEERINKLAEYEKKFESTQKEKEIEILKRDGALQELKIKQQQIVVVSVFGGALLLLVVVLLLFRSNSIKRKANNELIKKNTEIMLQKEEIESQKDEIEAQRDMVITQKERIEDINTKMTDSLRYAQSIQHAILPSEKTFAKISSEYFLFMSPCELVSGDFAWAISFDSYHIFCVADCTGHGVPGAFMSVLGISALNEIVSHHRENNAGKILDLLRENVIEALNQNEPSHLHKDGIDIGLCIYNSSVKELQFAGARIPLWLVSKNETNIDFSNCSIKDSISANGFTLNEIKADIMPVGISPLKSKFRNVTIKLNGNPVSLYLSTDGFADQFGGNDSGKYGKGRLKQLILENHLAPLADQKTIFESSFLSWMGLNSQIDDVAVIGIKI